MMEREELPQIERLADFAAILRRRRVGAALVFGEANVRSLVGIVCDNACLVVSAHGDVELITDFRYVPMVHRVAPWLRTIQLRRGVTFADAVRESLQRMSASVSRLGFEGSICASRYLSLTRAFGKSKMIDIADELLALRAVKTVDEMTRIAAAAALNDDIWLRARKEIRAGMTEKDIQRTIRAWMNALGDGEAFETIVCAGSNAAECHHVPDETVWRRGDPLLVDMGVKLDGVCSDMTRCIRAKNDAEYSRVYDLVLAANRAGVAAARPGITAGELDRVARSIIARAGYGRAFGHSLGHGVGYEIHEAPTARVGDSTVLEPGMVVTIEPGVYLEGRLGVRIEDLVLITSSGCETLSHSAR